MKKEDIIDLLKMTELFKSIPDKTIAELLEQQTKRTRQYNKGQLIHIESEKCINLEIILKGSVKVQKNDENGNILTIVEFEALDDIGGNLLFGDQNSYLMNVVAKTDCEIFNIHYDNIIDLCQKNRDFLLAFLKTISTKANVLGRTIKKISHKSIRDKITDYIKYEMAIQNKKTIKLTCSKTELAERFGIQRTSLSRELQKMKNEGIIEYNIDIIKIISI